MPSTSHQVGSKLFWMVSVALVLRLAAMALFYPLQLYPTGNHRGFGWETGQIAHSIAIGHGFSSPLYFAETGPTAWMTPVYPYMVAGVFKIFGVFSKASAFVLLGLNAIFSALTCLPIFFFTRRSFGTRAGLWAGWMWAVFLYSIVWPEQLVWSTWLITLLLAILFAMSLGLRESLRIRDWIAFGALSGVAGLTDPAVMSVLPFLALWALWRNYKRAEPGGGRPWKRLVAPALACLLATLVVIAPWFVRNYVVFHRFIPFRDSFGVVLRAGNVGDSTHMLAMQAGPWRDPAEMSEFLKYGELGYMDEKEREALAYIAAHRKEYVESCAQRFVYVWTHVWLVPRHMMPKVEEDPSEIFLFTGLSFVMLAGLATALKRKPDEASPYLIALILFPLVYYLTSLEPRYRVPIDPMIMALAAYGIVSHLHGGAEPAPARAHLTAELRSSEVLVKDSRSIVAQESA